MADAEVRIGQLRWPVTIARRRQNFDPPGAVSIFEDWVSVDQVHAEIMPIAAITFYGSEQVDMPVTHRVTVRWLNYLDNTYIVARTILLPNSQTRGELYRVRRVKELNGRKRFSSLECELELVQAFPLVAPAVDPLLMPPADDNASVPPISTYTPPTPITTPAAPDGTLQIVAGTFIAANTAIELDARGAAIPADPTDRLFSFAGIALGDTPAGQPVSVLDAGLLTLPSPRWTPGQSIFIGPAGDLTQVVPLTGISQQVGIAVTSSSMLLQVLPPVWLG